MQTLPGGPSESEALAALKLRREALLNNHEALARKCVPRPDQSQYADVQVRSIRFRFRKSLVFPVSR